jgi:hypothetical protein
MTQAEVELTDALLLAAFAHGISEPDAASGVARLQRILGGAVGEAEIHAALAAALAARRIHDPVRLPPGALQCHWQLDLTPDGIAAVRDMLREHGRREAEAGVFLRELVAGWRGAATSRRG